jgi:hypothetical protein
LARIPGEHRATGVTERHQQSSQVAVGVLFSSVVHYKKTAITPQQAGRELNVEVAHGQTGAAGG